MCKDCKTKMWRCHLIACAELSSLLDAVDLELKRRNL